MNAELQAAIRKVMSDGQSRSAKGIRRELLQMGMDESISRIANTCSHDSKIERIGTRSDRAEYRMVKI